MRPPRLIWGLGLAAFGLLLLFVMGSRSARGTVPAELATVRRMGHPTSLTELAARHPSVPPPINAGPALEAVLGQVIDNPANPATAALLDPD